MGCLGETRVVAFEEGGRSRSEPAAGSPFPRSKGQTCRRDVDPARRHTPGSSPAAGASPSRTTSLVRDLRYPNRCRGPREWLWPPRHRSTARFAFRVQARMVKSGVIPDAVRVRPTTPSADVRAVALRTPTPRFGSVRYRRPNRAQPNGSCSESVPESAFEIGRVDRLI